MFSSNSTQVSNAVNYIEDVFSTYLYTGTGTGVTQRIASGIDLATKGGMVWTKTRAVVQDHQIFDTVRGERKYIRSNTTDAEFDSGANSVQYKTSGWDAFAYVNDLNVSFASWTFRKQAKFFDVATGTVNSSGGITINHSLGATPGFVILKDTTAAQNWWVWHRSYGANDQYQFLNTTAAQSTFGSPNTWVISSTQVGITDGSTGGPFTSGDSYVAYVFAHNAGGFGLTGTDNVISCGSFSGSVSVNLGYEPQWVLVKNTGIAQDWRLYDTMRGLDVDGNVQLLRPNLANAEVGTSGMKVESTGFYYSGGLGNNYIYIAIRRGPMKVPTVGTSVYNAILRTGTGSSQTDTGIGFAPDWALIETRSNSSDKYTFSRLQGNDVALLTNTTEAEFSSGLLFNGATGTITNTVLKLVGRTYVDWYFGRAPSVFDIVCDTGTGVAKTVTHNLGVIPELVIRKSRSNTGPYWLVGSTYLSYANDEYLQLQATDAVSAGGGSYWNSTAPTSSVFSVGNNTYSNGNGYKFITYLFASCAGVSKVGTYTGNGTTQTINCGFTGGARWVLIKRINSTSDWYVYDTTRGMTTVTDPYLLLNVTDAETATLGSVTTVSTGFALNSTILAAINVSGGTYIFLAIA